MNQRNAAVDGGSLIAESVNPLNLRPKDSGARKSQGSISRFQDDLPK